MLQTNSHPIENSKSGCLGAEMVIISSPFRKELLCLSRGGLTMDIDAS
jgi:hypothetical protein